jgi:Reverse transcriptase (RNA-dependent DNA polymerase)
MFSILYVDDLLFVTNDMSMLRETKKILYEFFEMKHLGEISYVLGLKIHRDRSQGILGLSQQTYIIGKVLRECLALNGIAKSWNKIAIPTN